MFAKHVENAKSCKVVVNSKNVIWYEDVFMNVRIVDDPKFITGINVTVH